MRMYDLIVKINKKLLSRVILTKINTPFFITKEIIDREKN